MIVCSNCNEHQIKIVEVYSAEYVFHVSGVLKVIDLWAVQVWGWFVMICIAGFYLLNLIPLFFLSISIYLSLFLSSIFLTPAHRTHKSLTAEVNLIELDTWVSIDVFKY